MTINLALIRGEFHDRSLITIAAINISANNLLRPLEHHVARKRALEKCFRKLHADNEGVDDRVHCGVVVHYWDGNRVRCEVSGGGGGSACLQLGLFQLARGRDD